MSLVFVSPGGSEGGGGMGTVTRGIVGELRARHPATPVVVLDPRGIVGELRARHPATPVVVLDPRGDGSVWLFPFHFIGAFAALLRTHATSRIDILHLNVSERLSIPRKALFLLYGRLFGIPVVLHHHGAEFIPEYRRRGALYRRLVRWAVHAADCNIVLGRDWEKFLAHDLGVAPARISLMYNAVADSTRAQDEPASRGQTTVHLLILANLSARKGIPELLAAMRILTEAGYDVTLTLAGGGEVAAFTDMAQRLCLGARCRFTGWLPATEAAALWSAADIFVLPSHHEGLPMAILEALSQRVAVVATPVGAIPEVLTSGRDCLLVPPGDAAALAAALRRLIDAPEERQALARAGRRLFEERFALATYVDDLLRLYGRVQPPHLERRRA